MVMLLAIQADSNPVVASEVMEIGFLPDSLMQTQTKLSRLLETDKFCQPKGTELDSKMSHK